MWSFSPSIAVVSHSIPATDTILVIPAYMHKPQEHTDTQIIIPFVQMSIPVSHPRNGAKLKTAYIWAKESKNI